MADLDARIREELDKCEMTFLAKDWPVDALRAVLDLCDFADETFPHTISPKYLRETIARELGVKP